VSKPFDATTKRLLEMHPEDWVAFLGLPAGAVTVLDADLSTVTAAADRLIRVDAAVPYILHNEFESGKDTASVPLRALHYSVNAEVKYGLPVVSTVVLLRKGSDSRRITGRFERRGPDGSVYTVFHYHVVKIWLTDPESLLTGGLSLLPFAPIAAVKMSELRDVIARMGRRIDAEATSDAEAAELWVATFVLMGLRYNRDLNAQLLQGVRRMKESVTYQAIVEEGIEVGQRIGEIRGEITALIRFGSKRLGQPSEETVTRLRAIDSAERVEALLDRLSDVETWDDLLRSV
jgi:predicted transposase YdaD